MTENPSVVPFNQPELWYCPTCACHHAGGPCMPLKPSER